MSWGRPSDASSVPLFMLVSLFMFVFVFVFLAVLNEELRHLLPTCPVLIAEPQKPHPTDLIRGMIGNTH